MGTGAEHVIWGPLRFLLMKSHFDRLFFGTLGWVLSDYRDGKNIFLTRQTSYFLKDIWQHHTTIEMFVLTDQMLVSR